MFFVHNRIHDINKVAARVQQIVPEASIGIAHGRLNETELEEVMVGFVQGKIDILLANTIFIDEADLHQLRGRVGRSHHRAWCYLLVDEAARLTATAAKRLRAIQEFSSMGAGFSLAMRDLEIRGAGNLLGTQQSGHIATVGYELYCRLLETAVRGLKKMPPAEPPPVTVEDELRGYLACGLLCFGFARAVCMTCRTGFVVAFSCKGRGVCPSCNGRHMSQTASHLVDHVIPPVPVRQWVISVPKRRRSR